VQKSTGISVEHQMQLHDYIAPRMVERFAFYTKRQLHHQFVMGISTKQPHESQLWLGSMREGYY